ncbi:SDR family NAD(P)-dependent oxidoreductase [Peristeroidobacter soli]|jgi:NAD(P)-dependent dehydrogenase (short-subunit alcohol dehydrogenase family)|uniref:SDR family NAD(P)-dependent oxidoreductase n=1 Tax=Peristeroidobacter soli TaxID=2497877 RepID=UPI00101B63E8|nr:SDR family oxidoreductase [Peristeroidobacter soli]
MRDIAGMSVLVTGGGSGLGEGTARHFAARGARVTICGRRRGKLEAVANSIGPACHFVEGDITNANDRAGILGAAIAHGDGLHALINNAGNMYRGPLVELEERQLLDVFNSNVVSAMMLSGLAVPHLARTRGAIVFIGSVHTRRAYPGASPYAATKGAVEVLTRVLAAELGSQKIRVNCVVPGAVFTEINQRAGLLDDAAARKRLDAMASSHVLGRIGTEEEIAEAIAYLSCAEWTTGAVLEVDGGLGLGLSPG